MKELLGQVVGAARARPVRFTILVLLALIVFSIGASLGDPLGREMYLLLR